MEPALAKRMIDACYEAEGILNAMPPLPEGMTAQYMRMIEVIHDLMQEGSVRVSEIAEKMHLYVSGVTRSLKALEKLGAVEKQPEEKDRRAVRIVLTEKGENWYQVYIVRFYENLCGLLEDIPEEDMHTVIDTLYEVHARMRQNRGKLL